MKAKQKLSGMMGKVNIRQSINTKIILLIFIILALTMLGMGWQINNTVSKEITELARERNLGIAEGLEGEVEALLLEVENVVNLVSHQEAIIEGGEQDSAANFFAILKEDYQVLDDIYFLTSPDSSDWYQSAVNKGDLVWSNVRRESGTDKLLITAAKPVFNENNNLVGVIGADLALATINNIVEQIEIGEKGYAFIVNEQGEIIAHKDNHYVEDRYDLSQEFNLETVLGNENGHLEYEFNGEVRLASYTYLPRIEGAVMAQIPVEEAYQATANVRTQILVTSLIIMLITSLTILFVIRRYLIKPILMLTEKMEKVAEGDLTFEMKMERKDEIGILIANFNDMVNQLQDLVENIKDTSDDVIDTANNLEAISEETGATSQQVASSIQEVAVGAEDQAKSVENVTAKVQSLSSGLERLNSINKRIEKISDQTTRASSTGRKDMKEVKDQMNRINASITEVAKDISQLKKLSDEIDAIIDIINNIAGQTNLLALNAAIEAARAGEAGRGFSVVADEIRELAEESADSADKIKSLIVQIKEKTNEAGEQMEIGTREVQTGQNVVDSADKSFDEINEKVKEIDGVIDDSVEVIKKSNVFSDEIVSNIENIAAISEETAAGAEEVAAAGQEQSASVEEVAARADNLSNRAFRLEKLIEKFEI